jgi:microcystin degradation protein MlrC
MRLAMLGFYHETNTFAANRSTWAEWQKAGIHRGQEVLDVYGESEFSIAGFMTAARQPDVEIVPLMFTFDHPKGMITADAYERVVGELLDLLCTHGPWDGILLVLHGAAVAENALDADGECLPRVRALVGPDVPIGVASDAHGNITQRYVENCTAASFFRTNPHLDAFARAAEVAEIIVRTVRGEIHPVQALETPPLVINIVKQWTDENPSRRLMADVEAVLQRPGMLSASAVLGYPYADVEEMGMSFLAVHDGDPQAAREAARWMARRAWDHRAEMLNDTPSPEEALRHAAAAAAHPIVLLDVGDNVGAGSTADSTILLEIAQRLGIRDYLQSLYDPDAVEACVAAGVGETVTLTVGGKTDRMHGGPVAVTGRVRTISEGKWEDTRPTHGGYRYYDAGKTAVLETTDGHTLVLHARRLGNYSIGEMYSVGIFPEEYQVVVAKGVQSPRPAYQPIAAEVIMVNTPGVSTADLDSFTYTRRRHPLYPFERDAAYE